MAEFAFERLTRRAKQALHFASEESQALNHSYVGAEHLLLGLVREGVGVAARVLDEIGIRLIPAREMVAALVNPGAGQQRTGQHLSSSARTVIAHAMQEADQLGHSYVGTEHLLLGLLCDPESIAVDVLRHLGASLELIRDQVMDVVRDAPYATMPFVERSVGGALDSVGVAPPPVRESQHAANTRTGLRPVESHARLTTHVLDTAQGRPAAHLRIELWWLGSNGHEHRLLKTVVTNDDGRTDLPLLVGDDVLSGIYELVFVVGPYFANYHLVDGRPPFFDQISVRFRVTDLQSHYHIPLLVSPWAYSTYRGS